MIARKANPLHLNPQNLTICMKSQNLLAVVLIVIGIVAFAYQGITYTTREKAVDLGPIQITAEKTHTIPLPPIVGGVALVAGLLLLVAAGKKA
jgi:UDP-N-acetylmuramyl pentapeptide phosphotransferase/UDP-N-acetylglucosamine-1-phosphate transferase